MLDRSRSRDRSKAGGAFSPAGLFVTGAQGAWYDPSDYSTLFQNSTGTTPVTAVEQPVRLMLDRSRGLVLGSELVTNGTFTGGSTTGWSGFGANNWSTSNDAATHTAGVYGTVSVPVGTWSISAGKWYRVEFDVTVTASSFFAYLKGAILNGGNAINSAGRQTFYVTAGSSGASDFLLEANAGFTGAVDNISVRELPGNHALAPNDASRPILRARYNLLTRTEEFDDAAWTNLVINTGATPIRTANAGTDPLGGTTADRLQFSRTLSGFPERSAIINGTVTFVSGTQYTASFYAKSFSGVDQEINLIINANGAVLQTFTATSSWQRFTYTFTSGATFTATASAFRIGLIDAASSALTSDVLLWGASLLTAADQASTGGAYQRVAAATDYDTSNPVWRPYLAFDGSDDSFGTSAIDFSGTDEMTVFAGVTKLSDAVVAAIIAELSSGATNNKYTLGGYLAGTPDYYFHQSGGTSLANATATSSVYAAPVTNVLTGSGDISAPVSRLRINGSVIDTNTATQGTGNYPNAPLFIGRRNNVQFPFNGRLYGLTVLGRTATAAELSAMETWIAGKTGVTLP